MLGTARVALDEQNDDPELMSGLLYPLAEGVIELFEQHQQVCWANDELNAKLTRLEEQLEAAQREIKQLRKALEHEVTARLLPLSTDPQPPLDERDLFPASEPKT